MMDCNLGTLHSSKTHPTRQISPLEPIRFLEGSKELETFPYDLQKQLEAYCQRHHRRDLYGATKVSPKSGDLYHTGTNRKARFIHPERHDEELLAARYSYGTKAIITVVQQKSGNDLNDGRAAVIFSGGGGGKQMLWDSKWSQAFRFTIWDVSERGHNGLDFVFRQVDYSDKFKDPIPNGLQSKDTSDSVRSEDSYNQYRARVDSEPPESTQETAVYGSPRSGRARHRQTGSDKDNIQQDRDTIVLERVTPNDSFNVDEVNRTSKSGPRFNTEGSQNNWNAGRKRTRSNAAQEGGTPNHASQKSLGSPNHSKRHKNAHRKSENMGMIGVTSHQKTDLVADEVNNEAALETGRNPDTRQARLPQTPLIEKPGHFSTKNSNHQSTKVSNDDIREGHQRSVSILTDRTRHDVPALDFIFKNSYDDQMPYRRTVKQNDNLKILFTIARIAKGTNPANSLWIVVDDITSPISITEDDEELFQDILDVCKFAEKSNIVVLTSFENNDATIL